MFLARRPSRKVIDRFIRESQRLPLSYGPVGIGRTRTAGQHVDDDVARFGFAYGTLTNHAESGEELFEVFIHSRREDVVYRIRAKSWPQAMLARFGQPIVRLLQERFRDHSVAAMKLATRSNGGRA
jgi:uncharacterized protein (UPF0548 family)